MHPDMEEQYPNAPNVTCVGGAEREVRSRKEIVWMYGVERDTSILAVSFLSVNYNLAQIACRATVQGNCEMSASHRAHLQHDESRKREDISKQDMTLETVVPAKHSDAFSTKHLSLDSRCS